MAEQSAAYRKAQLIAELAQSRAEFAQNFRGAKSNLDIGAHLKQAFFRQKAVWITGAAIGGWLLTKLPFPFRKKKEKRTLFAPSIMPSKKETGWSALLLGALSLAGTLLRPALTSFATQKLAELATRKDFRAPKTGRTSRENSRY